MTWLESAWYNNDKRSYLLLPLMWLFAGISKTRRFLFRLGILSSYQSKLPVIVVGNIAVGGTGKTPFVIYLAKLLSSQGYKVAVVSRGYGSKEDDSLPYPRVINKTMDVSLSGDEPKLIYLSGQCEVVIDPNRVRAIQYIENNLDADVIISDDGLQHYAMSRALELVIVDQQRQFGNGMLLPVGPLREPVSRLEQVDEVIYANGDDYQVKVATAHQLVEPSVLLAPGSKVHLVSGIANPQRFLQSAKDMGYHVESTNWFADHHPFKKHDFTSYGNNDIVLITAKDAVKCQSFALANVYVLPINAAISDTLSTRLVNHINKITKV